MSAFPEDLQKSFERSSNVAVLHLACISSKSVARVFQEVKLPWEFCLKVSHYIKTKLTFSMIELHSGSWRSFLNLVPDKLLAASSSALISIELFCYNKNKNNLPWCLRSTLRAKSFVYKRNFIGKVKQKHFKRVM